MASDEEQEYDEVESVTDGSDSDYSEEDPNFEIEERLSKLSFKKKPKPRILKEDAVAVEMILPELDEKDQKSFETVQKIIEAGQVEKLKVDQCKVYLRKHGLRLTGNKDTLIERIEEHHDIVKGSGENKYPASSFILNCKGDACTGDVVMFEQNVYEMFSIASRNATAPPCGTRVVAGRIVKESYGAAKQQHTFTIEVLWSKGEKPLPPLHPLLIKGRNLYRLKTMRRRWEDEGERQKRLMEKHTRGSVARSKREERIQEKEKQKMLKANRVSGIENQNGKQDDGKRKKSQSLPISLDNPKSCFDERQAIQNTNQGQKFQQMSSPSKAPPPCKKPASTFCANSRVPPVNVHQRQPLTIINYNPGGGYERQYTNNPNSLNIPLESNAHQLNMNFIPSKSLSQMDSHNEQRNPFQRQGPVHQKQLCPYYPQGRC